MTRLSGRSGRGRGRFGRFQGREEGSLGKGKMMVQKETSVNNNSWLGLQNKQVISSKSRSLAFTPSKCNTSKVYT